LSRVFLAVFFMLRKTDPAVPTTDAPKTGMTFGRHVEVVTALVGALLLSIAFVAIGWQLTNYSSATRTVDRLQTFRATLVAMEKLSAERGPTNGALGADLPVPQAQKTALAAARGRSDAALADLLARLRKRHCPACAQQYAAAQAIQADFAGARANVDRLLAVPLAERSADTLDRTIVAMADVIPEFDPLARATLTDIVNANLRVSVPLLTTQQAAQMREQAGLLGSRFTGALGARRALTDAEQQRIEATRGRVDQLLVLIDAEAASLPGPQQAALARMKTQYIGAGLDYVARVRQAATLGSPDMPTPQQFATRYVPLMQPIVELRDASLDLAEQQLLARRSAALPEFIGVVCGVVAGLALLLFVAAQIRRQIIRPLTAATEAIVSIGSGDFSQPAPGNAYRGEMHALFRAVRTLRENNLDRLQSIQYASLIQRAILPERRAAALLGQRFAALWRPRDTVGGDFWLCRETADGYLVGLIDCAGHGVPGAMMTMLAHAMFEQAIDRAGPDPAAILQAADQLSRTMLAGDRFDATLAATMEAGLVHVDRRANRLTFSGARMALFASNGEQVRRYAGARRALGDTRRGQYENVELPLDAGWTFSLVTDGFLDQSGGSEGFGFGTGRFQQMLQDHALASPAAQIHAYDAALIAWRGRRAQRDDVTLLTFQPGENHDS